jgi:type IV pilus assembly protein PilM
MSNLPKIGIDIGSSLIKAVELNPRGRDWRLSSAISLASPVGGLIINNRESITNVAQVLSRVVKEAGFKSTRAVLSLPEDKVFTHLVNLPKMKDEEVEQTLQWQVEQYIPMPVDQTTWSYQIIGKDGTESEGLEVLLIAAPKLLVETYKSVVDIVGLELLAIETELVAISRSIVPANSLLNVVLDLGSTTTGIGVVNNGLLVFSRSIPTAGDAFNRAIASFLDLDIKQAEEYKNSYGFSAKYLDGKLIEAMKPVMGMIVEEIKKTIDYYTSKHTGQSPTSVIITGGVSVTPDIISQMSIALGMEVVLGDAFNKIKLDDSQHKALAGTFNIYSVATGLALREI